MLGEFSRATKNKSLFKLMRFYKTLIGNPFSYMIYMLQGNKTKTENMYASTGTG